MFGGRHSLVIKFIAPYFFCLGAYSTKHEESKGLCSDTLAHTNSSVKSRHPHRIQEFFWYCAHVASEQQIHPLQGEI